MKKKKKVFVDGPILPGFIAESIAGHSTKHDIGAHAIFLGQVRGDRSDGKTVRYIDYSAYSSMAEKVFDEIREEAFETFELTCGHIYHSLGKVRVGEISLFVFVSSIHRQASFDACHSIVDQIKDRVPIFGKEVYDEDSHTWKVNR